MSGLARLVPARPFAVPTSLAALVGGYDWARDTVGESGGMIHRLTAADRTTLYLKHGQREVAVRITEEMVRLEGLAGHVPVPGVRGFVSLPDQAWLLMTEMPGRTAHQCLTANAPDRVPIAVAIATFLHRLHALPVEQCPFNSGYPLRLAQARQRMEADEVDAIDFGEAHAGWTPERVWDEMTALLPLIPDPVVTHGDFSLDNILIEGGGVTGCIDIGLAGVADRYQDLAILHDSLGEFGRDAQAAMWRAYGIVEPDPRKIAFHLCLDEFF